MICVEAPKVYAQNFREPDLRVILDGVLLRDDDVAEIINGEIYIPVRKFCEMFGARVIWRSNVDDVLVFYNRRLYKLRVVIRNSVAMMPAYNLNMVFGHLVEYFKNYRILSIDTRNIGLNKNDLENIIPSFEGYTPDDLKWLSKIIHAEAKGESHEGKLAVGNVILNRTKNPMYPDTIEEVIFDRRNGVQFSPIINGAINNAPSTSSLIAAIEVLEGKRNAKGVLFFMNPSIAQSTWISNNRQLAFTMQNHDFFY